MIKGIGSDILEIKRMDQAVTKPRFMEKYFTSEEIAHYEARKNNIEILAGNFAVKEAVSKVFGTGVRGFGLKDIEVLRDPLGKPYVVLYGEALNIAENMGIQHLHVSISHTKEYVVGFAIGEGQEV